MPRRKKTETAKKTTSSAEIKTNHILANKSIIEEEIIQKIRTDKNSNILNLNELRRMSIDQLIEMAENIGLEDYSRLKKAELVFKILNQKARNENVELFGGGVLEISHNNNFGFLRASEYHYKQSLSDIYVPPQIIKQYSLKTGDVVFGKLRPPDPTREKDNYFALQVIGHINYDDPEVCKTKIPFEDLTPIFPNEKFNLEYDPSEVSTRLIDMFAPIGKGQRALIVAPPKSGKTIILQQIAKAIVTNHPEVIVIVLLIDERPEEVTDFKRVFSDKDNVEVVASTFDEDPKNHIHLAELVKEKAKRFVEHGRDVVILLDSITRLTRAYNATLNSSGKVLSGGIDVNAFSVPKSFFGAARKIEAGGSLTIIATALIETGSKMDEVIFEEFKGTGNMELVLDRKMADRRIFPAIDLIRSGTRREELLLREDIKQRVWILRKIFAETFTNSGEIILKIKDKIKEFPNNEEFLSNLQNIKF